MPETTMTHADKRLAQLLAAQRKALELLDAIENARFIRAGRGERDVEQDIKRLAEERFGIRRDWHKRIVRAGANTLAIARDNPPTLTIGQDDIVFLDLGPVVGEWEADIGRTYVIGNDARKQALCAELPKQFERIRSHLVANPDISGEALYRFACESACDAGWVFGGQIAGHIVSEFPHARIPGPKDLTRIGPGNDQPLSDPDAFGRTRYWIIEVHLVEPDGSFGGFYEQLAHS